ncbi:MAG: hypothetical protein AB8G14_08905 [Ilumatobacter sp.]
MGRPEQWYWDLKRQRVVPAAERGKGDDMLGPYNSPAQAQNWRSTVESRNDNWDDADDEWNETELEPD